MDSPMNAADRVARASIEDQFSGRQAAWAAGLDDNIVLEDRRRGGVEVFRGKDVVLAEWGEDAWGEAGDLRTAEVETVAVRGEHLVLLSGVNSIGDIVRYSWIGIDRITRDELVDLIVLFDSDHLEAATAELDRLHGSAGA